MKKVTAHQLEEKLCHAFENDRNVMIEGKHGVGKTSIINKIIAKYGLKYPKDVVCFSAATMDPWIDFLGVPKLINNSEGEPSVRLIKPEYIDPCNLKILFFDEFNRSPKRVRNAVMELIQFKSVNGVKFPKLKCIWAAINPEDENETYDVEKTDPAQYDRFHMHLYLEDTINIDYFSHKFGEDKALHAKEWYEGLEPSQKQKVSPRRIEYALEEIKMGGDPEDVLPSCIKVSEFIDSINARNFKSLVIKAATERGVSGAKEILNDFDKVTEIINKTENETVMEACLELVNQEQLSACLSQSISMRNWCQKQLPQKGKRNTKVDLTKNQKKIMTCMLDISSSKNNKSLASWAEAMLSITIPGHKFLTNKIMTPSEFGYQASERYDVIKKIEWENTHPNNITIKNWTEIININFSDKTEKCSINSVIANLEVIEDAIKSKKCRSMIDNDKTYENTGEKISQLLHYYIFDYNTKKNSIYGPDDIDTVYFISKFHNIHKNLLLTKEILSKKFSIYKLTEQSNSFEEIK